MRPDADSAAPTAAASGACHRAGALSGAGCTCPSAVAAFVADESTGLAVQRRAPLGAYQGITGSPSGCREGPIPRSSFTAAGSCDVMLDLTHPVAATRRALIEGRGQRDRGSSP